MRTHAEHPRSSTLPWAATLVAALGFAYLGHAATTLAVSLDRASLALEAQARVTSPVNLASHVSRGLAAAYGVPEELGTYAAEAARAERLPPGVLFRLVERESGWHPAAIGRHGEVGLGQVKPATAGYLGVGVIDREALFEPRLNLRVAARYLAYLRDKYDGDLHRALRAYNAGPTGSSRATWVSRGYADEVYGAQIGG